MIDRPLVYEDFADKVGDDFVAVFDDGPSIAMSLAEAAPLASHGAKLTRPPFSLVFVAAEPRVLPQRLYRLRHAALGDIDIFLVPVGKDERGICYQATFN